MDEERFDDEKSILGEKAGQLKDKAVDKVKSAAKEEVKKQAKKVVKEFGKKAAEEGAKAACNDSIDYINSNITYRTYICNYIYAIFYIINN